MIKACINFEPTNNQEREISQLRMPKSIGQTLISSSKVAARWFIFKQVFKLQILIRTIDSTELFLQIFLVVKRGHLSNFSPHDSSEFRRSDGDAAEVVRRLCGFGEVSNDASVSCKSSCFSSPQLFSNEGGSICTLNFRLYLYV